MRNFFFIFIFLLFNYLLFGQSKEQEAKIMYQLAQEEYENNCFSKALDYLLKVEKISEPAAIKCSYLKARCYERQFFHIDSIPFFRTLITKAASEKEKILTTNYPYNEEYNFFKTYQIDYTPYLKFLDAANFYLQNGKDELKKNELIRIKLKVENSEEYNLVLITELYLKALNSIDSGNYTSALVKLEEAKKNSHFKSLFFNPLLPADIDEKNYRSPTVKTYCPNFSIDLQILISKLSRYDCDLLISSTNIFDLIEKMGLQIPRTFFLNPSNVGIHSRLDFDRRKATMSGDYSVLCSNFTKQNSNEFPDGSPKDLFYLYTCSNSTIKRYAQQALFCKFLSFNQGTLSCSYGKHFFSITTKDLFIVTKLACNVYVLEKNLTIVKKYCQQFLDLSKKFNFQIDIVDLIYLNYFLDPTASETMYSNYIVSKNVNWYEAACLALQNNKNELALQYIENHLTSISSLTTEKGYYDCYYLKFDWNLLELNKDARFLDLLKKYYSTKF